MHTDRVTLNADTTREMYLAFHRGGRKAARVFLKLLVLLVLLVARELEVTHNGGVRSMTDEQLEQGIRRSRPRWRPAGGARRRSQGD